MLKDKNLKRDPCLVEELNDKIAERISGGSAPWTLRSLQEQIIQDSIERHNNFIRREYPELASRSLNRVHGDVAREFEWSIIRVYFDIPDLDDYTGSPQALYDFAKHRTDKHLSERCLEVGGVEGTGRCYFYLLT